MIDETLDGSAERGDPPRWRDLLRWRGRSRTPLDELAMCAGDLGTRGLTPGGLLAICCRPASGPSFAAARERVAVAAEPRARLVHWEWDVHGQQWALLSSDSLRRMTGAASRVEQTLARRGFSGVLLWTVLALRDSGDQPVQLVYDHRHRAFYPFAPRSEHTRDGAVEEEVATMLGGIVPLVSDPGQWLPLWENPLSRA
jgi:hypothetical protein